MLMEYSAKKVPSKKLAKYVCVFVYVESIHRIHFCLGKLKFRTLFSYVLCLIISILDMFWLSALFCFVFYKGSKILKGSDTRISS